MSTPKTVVLMSADHPEGWKLEELLAQIAQDLRVKNDHLEGDSKPTSRAVVLNNLGIIDCLALAEVRQRDTLRRLNVLGADPGPTGTPRIGAGSAGTAPPGWGADPALSAAAPAIPLAPIVPPAPVGSDPFAGEEH